MGTDDRKLNIMFQNVQYAKVMRYISYKQYGKDQHEFQQKLHRNESQVRHISSWATGNLTWNDIDFGGRQSAQALYIPQII